MAPGQSGHARLQRHIEVGRSSPGGQIEDQQREGSTLQQLDGRGGGQLGLFGKDDHQMSQIDAGSGQVGRKRGGFGVADPGRPLAGALTFQQQLEGRAKMASTLTGQLDHSAFGIDLGHSST